MYGVANVQFVPNVKLRRYMVILTPTTVPIHLDIAIYIQLYVYHVQIKGKNVCGVNYIIRYKYNDIQYKNTFV